MGRDRPVSSIFTAHVACNDALCLPAAAGFCRASSMRVPERGHEIPPQDTHATHWLSLTFRGKPEPSHPILPPGKGRSLLLYASFHPPGGRAFFCPLPFPTRGMGLVRCPTTPCRATLCCDAKHVGRQSLNFFLDGADHAAGAGPLV
jgi:hypothetical protein